MVDGVGAVWVLAHHKSGISQLAIRDSGVHCGDFLWVDMAENGVDLRVGYCARIGGCDLALLVPNRVSRHFETIQMRTSYVHSVIRLWNIGRIRTYSLVVEGL